MVLAFCVGLSACGAREQAPMVLATTSSVANSGLLDQLLPAYEGRIRTVPVGSGLALDLLERGDADVAITHAPQREAAALREHPHWHYRKVLYNDFLLVGPPDDPAGVAGTTDAVIAMQRIAASGATFLSRGDESGTHERERQLWAEAGTTPPGNRLVVAGAGMGQTLRIASNTDAYTLTDRGTFESLQRALRSRIVCKGDPRLLNTYAVISDPANEAGHRFAQWVTNGPGRAELERIVTGPIRGFSVWPAGVSGDRPDSRPR